MALDYWDFLNDYMRGSRGGTSLYNMYRALYDNSHGALRYGLSKYPILGGLLNLDDELRQAEDAYDRTGVDPQYVGSYSRLINSSGNSVSGLANSVSRMARSLSDVYSPEIIENVSSAFNHSYM